ncbi:MAG TPA: FAD-dependent oxidoreductase [Ramlibacter sp.]|nr:FAD-dependent oxidoreductase [Ramlibacter sp.]
MAKHKRNIAVIGAGIAGLACARTLTQAGHQVTVLEKSTRPGGRAASHESPFGTFDHGTQYFTVRDARFERALSITPARRPWSANAVRVLDPHGRVAEAALPSREAHWVGVPSMEGIARHWAEPLAASGCLQVQARVTRVERDTLDAKRWQLQTSGPDDSAHVYSGFDTVLLAMPASQSESLLRLSAVAPRMAKQMQKVEVAPCWTLMLAFPQAVEPTVTHIGPQWNAALSTHHRIAWLARESSKPGRVRVERWTVQASPAWSQEHLEDDAPRVQAKLLKAFAEVTGIHASPAYAEVHRWRWAKTQVPLGQSHLWDDKAGLGACGDWCLGHRMEDAFISGLELALKVHAG